jgi:hypothetical protein
VGGYEYPHLSLEHHLLRLSNWASRDMSKIRELQINVVYRALYCRRYPEEELFNLKRNRYDTPEQRAYHSYLYNATLFHFPGLRTINLEVEARDSKEEINRILTSITVFVEHCREKFHGGKAPQVVVRVVSFCPPKLFTVQYLIYEHGGVWVSTRETEESQRPARAVE